MIGLLASWLRRHWMPVPTAHDAFTAGYRDPERGHNDLAEAARLRRNHADDNDVWEDR